MPFFTRTVFYTLLSTCLFTVKTFSQNTNCNPAPSVALEYDVLKTGFINAGYDNLIVDDTVNLQSDNTFTVKAQFNSNYSYKVCLIADPSVDATGFELDDISGSPLDFTANYLEENKNELIYDLAPEPDGNYYLKFKAIKKSGAPTCAFIMVMQKKQQTN